MRMIACAASASGWLQSGSPSVGSLAQRRVERHLAEQADAQLVGELLPAAEPKISSPVPIRNDMFSIAPTSRMPVFCAICAARTATCCAAGCGVVTTSTSARGRSWPSEIETSPVPGRHVDDERVQLAPVHVGQELLERLVQHRPAPHDRRVVVQEEPDRHQLQLAADWRDDHPVDQHRLLVNAEHVRDRVAVDVGVEDPRPVSEPLEGRGEVGGERRLADAALAARDGQDASRGIEGQPFERGATPPRSFLVSAARSSGVMTSKASDTDSTPGSGSTCSRTWRSNESRSGQPATVSAIVTATWPFSTSTSRTMSSSVTGRFSSGSMTWPRASVSCSRDGCIAFTVAPPPPPPHPPPFPQRRAPFEPA